MKLLTIILPLILATNIFASSKGHEKHMKAANRVIKMVNHQFQGTKQWLPGTIAVKPGEEIELHLINKAPSGVHGFRIWDAKMKNALVTKNIPKGKTVKVRFTAGKKGDIHQFDCQLHGAHVGGQIIVL